MSAQQIVAIWSLCIGLTGASYIEHVELPGLKLSSQLGFGVCSCILIKANLSFVWPILRPGRSLLLGSIAEVAVLGLRTSGLISGVMMMLSARFVPLGSNFEIAPVVMADE